VSDDKIDGPQGEQPSEPQAPPALPTGDPMIKKASAEPGSETEKPRSGQQDRRLPSDQRDQ